KGPRRALITGCPCPTSLISQLASNVSDGGWPASNTVARVNCGTLPPCKRTCSIVSCTTAHTGARDPISCHHRPTDLRISSPAGSPAFTGRLSLRSSRRQKSTPSGSTITPTSTRSGPCKPRTISPPAAPAAASSWPTRWSGTPGDARTLCRVLRRLLLLERQRRAAAADPVRARLGGAGHFRSRIHCRGRRQNPGRRRSRRPWQPELHHLVGARPRQRAVLSAAAAHD